MDKQTAANYEHPLPLVDQEHALQGGFFYKTVERSAHSQTLQFSSRLGLKVYRCQQYQIDHLVFLAQLLNQHLSWCRLIFLQNSYLFIESILCFEEGQQHQFSFIKRERQLFSEMMTHSILIAKLIQQQLNKENFLSKDFSSQSFKQKIDLLLQKIEGEFKRGKGCYSIEY